MAELVDATDSKSVELRFMSVRKYVGEFKDGMTNGKGFYIYADVVENIQVNLKMV